MPLALLAPPEAWRHMLRATLRECSYLPDPVAKSYMRQYTLDRYRDKVNFFRSKARNTPPPSLQPATSGTSLERQARLRRSANKLLSLLRRANEGYKKQLERVLMLSYGRIGAKKYQLLTTLLRENGFTKQLTTDKEIEELIAKDGGHKFNDNWKPPPVLVALLKSQKNSSFVQDDRTNRFKLNPEPKIPELNSWLKPTPKRRRQKFRKQWYDRAKFGVLAPMNASELDILNGLLDGTLPWEAPVRRKKISPPAQAEASPLETLLLEGPQKGATFDPFVVERPHRITRRFMQRVWEKVYHRTPITVQTSKGPKYNFPTNRRVPPLTLAVKDEEVCDLFDGVDANGYLKESST